MLSIITAVVALVLSAKSLNESVYLDELVSADLRGVVVVGEGCAQLASLHVHSGLKKHRL